nr:serine/arginine repetitive matrix protein 2 [Oryctolagus cuniculus]
MTRIPSPGGGGPAERRAAARTCHRRRRGPRCSPEAARGRARAGRAAPSAHRLRARVRGPDRGQRRARPPARPVPSRRRCPPPPRSSAAHDAARGPCCRNIARFPPRAGRLWQRTHFLITAHISAMGQGICHGDTGIRSTTMQPDKRFRG